jgi:non-homologous end joining protein Ku
MADQRIAQQIAQADWLALQARAAAAAGDHERAKELREEFDDLYDRLEASLNKVEPCKQDNTATKSPSPVLR